MEHFRLKILCLTIIVVAQIGFIAPVGTIAEDSANCSSDAIKLDFSNVPADKVTSVKMGDKAYFHLDSVCRTLGLALEPQKNGEFILDTGKGIIRGKAGSTEIMIDDKKQYLPLPVMKIENQLFVPEHFLKSALTQICIK